MYMLKVLFQKLQIRPVLAPGKQLTSWGTGKDYPLGTSWRHPDLCVPGRDPRDTVKRKGSLGWGEMETLLGQNPIAEWAWWPSLTGRGCQQA